jgi:hypothetical protein
MQALSAISLPLVLAFGGWVWTVDNRVQAAEQELASRAGAIMTARANATEIALIKQAQGYQGKGIDQILEILSKDK